MIAALILLALGTGYGIHYRLSKWKLDRVEAWIDDVIDEQKELRRQLEAQDAVIAAMQATRGDMDDADWWRKRERP